MTTIMDVITTTVSAMANNKTDSGQMSTALMAATQKVLTEDELVAKRFHFVMSAVIGPIFCFFGMAGNILSIIVWNRPGMSSSTGRYLTGQAIADFLVLFFFLVCDSAQAWTPDIGHGVSYAVFFCYIGYPFFFLAIVVSIWITVGVTIDRYILVCWITKAKQLCNEKRANVGLILITINSFLINIPHFASFEANTDDSTVNNTIGNRIIMTEFESGGGGKFYEFWIHCIILILIPWFSVLYMNIMIIKQIRNTNVKMSEKKTRESKKKSKQSQAQITRLLLTVTFSFLVFIGMQCIIQCIFMQKPTSVYWPHVDASFAFAKTGVVFNSSLNFVFYCLMGRRFRQELFCLFRMKPKDSLTTSMAYTPSTGTTSATTSSTAKESY